MNHLRTMKLSLDEEIFLRHWMYDELHFRNSVGPAKQLQIDHRALPADLGLIIAAAIPDPIDQERAALEPQSEAPKWPWSDTGLRIRVAEARALLHE